MNFEQTVLPNGLRVLTSTRPETESVSLGVWVKTGSACEKEEINGISHFLEHMVFKGSSKRSQRQISEDIEDVGGQMNAYTAREFTSFYAKMLKNDGELAMDVIADFLRHPTFPEEELVKEREVVVQEIKQGIDTPDDVIFDHFQEAAFPNQAIGRTILGPAEKVRGFSSQDLRDYLNHNYAGENMVVCGVGNISHEQLLSYVKERFSSLGAKTDFKTYPQKYVGGFTSEKRDIEQAHVVLGFETFSYYNDMYYPCMLMSNILGGGSSSRLFQEVREKRGLVYTIYSFASSHTQTGLMGIYAGTGREELSTLMPVVCDEISKICHEKVSAKELDRAKVQLKAGMLMALESSSSVAEIMARQMLIYNRVIPVQEMVDRIDAVSLADIQNVAQKIFSSQPCYNLVGAIDNAKCPSYDELQKALRR